ncbi:hypothetical protein [Pararhodobacter sp.]|uniref:hypothetical protein n=1 Tax=Pararhodobacter sp. TaxID=2127056 RepID=UPI002FDCAB79
MDFDFESLNSAVGLAGDAGTATGKIANAISTVQGLFKKSEAAGNADIKLALSDLTLQVANAQVANADLKLQLSALQDKLREAQAFKSDLDRYALWETPAGAVVYRLEKDIRNGEPRHYLCPNCIETKRKSILQGHSGFRDCPNCQRGFSFDEMRF